MVSVISFANVELIMVTLKIEKCHPILLQGFARGGDGVGTVRGLG